MKRHIFFLILLFVLSIGAYGAVYTTPTDGDSLMLRFERQFQRLDSLIFYNDVFIPDYTSMVPIPEDELNAEAYSDVLSEVNAKKISALGGNSGLSITGQGYYRLSNPIGIDDDDDATAAYDAKFQLELRWSILNAFVLKKKGKVAAMGIQQDIDESIYERELLSQAVNRLEQTIKKYFEILLAGILNERMENISLMLLTSDYMRNDNPAVTSETMQLIRERADIVRQLSTMNVDAREKARFPHLQPATIHLDTVSLKRYIDQENASLNELTLRAALAEQESKNLSYWNSVEIAPFARYSLYVTGLMTHRSSALDVGLSLKFPFTTQSRRQSRVYQSESRLHDVRRELTLDYIMERVKVYSDELERLNEGLIMQWSAVQSLKKALEARRDIYKNVEVYNRLTRLRDYEIYLHELERTVSLQYKVDEVLLHLQSIMGDGRPILEFCSVSPLS